MKTFKKCKTMAGVFTSLIVISWSLCRPLYAQEQSSCRTVLNYFINDQTSEFFRFLDKHDDHKVLRLPLKRIDHYLLPIKKLMLNPKMKFKNSALGNYSLAKPLFKWFHDSTSPGYKEKINIPTSDFFNEFEKDVTYNFIINDSDSNMVMMKAGENWTVRGVLSKHFVLSNLSQFVRYAGEITFQSPNIIIIKNASGTYVPSAESLVQVQQLLQENFGTSVVVKIEFFDKEKENKLSELKNNFLKAAYEGNLSLLKEIYIQANDSQRPKLLSAKNERGKNALALASSHGHLLNVQTLVKEWNISLDAQDFKGSTALMKAAENGHSQVVQYLLISGANNLVDKNGRTAIMRTKKEEIIQMLKNKF